MLTINYTKAGMAYPDHTAESVVAGLSNMIAITINTSTSNIIDAIRAHVAEGKISHENVTIQFEGETIAINKYGALATWPEGFCDYEHKLVVRILKGAAARRKHND